MCVCVCVCVVRVCVCVCVCENSFISVSCDGLDILQFIAKYKFLTDIFM